MAKHMPFSRSVIPLAMTLLVAFGSHAQGQTQQWSQPTKTQQWSQPSKTDQLSQPSKTPAGSSQAKGQPGATQTQQWSVPVYTRKRTDAENAAIVDQIDRNAKRAAGPANRNMSQAQADNAARGADMVNKVYRDAYDRGLQSDRATFEADRRYYEDRRNRLGY